MHELAPNKVRLSQFKIIVIIVKPRGAAKVSQLKTPTGFPTQQVGSIPGWVTNLKPPPFDSSLFNFLARPSTNSINLIKRNPLPILKYIEMEGYLSLLFFFLFPERERDRMCS